MQLVRTKHSLITTFFFESTKGLQTRSIGLLQKKFNLVKRLPLVMAFVFANKLHCVKEILYNTIKLDSTVIKVTHGTVGKTQQ